MVRDGAASARLTTDPGLVSTDWRVYVLAARVVEFWQGDRDRLHTRVQYTRDSRVWTHHLLWP